MTPETPALVILLLAQILLFLECRLARWHREQFDQMAREYKAAMDRIHDESVEELRIVYKRMFGTEFLGRVTRKDFRQ